MLRDYIQRMARAGKRTMFIEQGVYRSRSYSYAEVIERAHAFSRWLAEQGLGRSRDGEPTRVLLWAPSSARWAISFYGCVLAGAVIVPMDAGFSPDFVRRIAAHTRAALIVTEPSLAEKLGDKDAAAPPHFLTHQLDQLPTGVAALNFAPARESLLEIVYTSGTTTEPRGVMITQANLLANLEPVEKEMRRYRLANFAVRPLRFLHLIPLSHLFGQVMGIFIPQFFEGEVVFPESQAPSELARVIRARRISLMISVPQQLEALGDWAAAQVGGEPAVATLLSERLSIPGRFWKYRRLHRTLGWKMWAFVVGGAALPGRVEKLWNALGYAVVQGYGLTETAPAIAITHPFKIRRGAVGRPLPGVETRIAADGEILVRGENVSPGYYRNPQATQQSFEDGWLRTGDFGRLDEEGNLVYLGRKKDVIVTAEGLNVFPEDVEQALQGERAIREVAVVGQEVASGEPGAPRRSVIHAVVVPSAGKREAEIKAAIERANQWLEAHQRIRGYSLWPGPSLPRTVTTQKIQRPAVAAWVNAGRRTDASHAAAPELWTDFLVRLGIPQGRLRPEARLAEDLGLSSLDRVELLTWLETHGHPVEEEAFSRACTVGDVEALVQGSVPRAGAPRELQPFPSGSAVAPSPRPLSRLEALVEAPPPLWPHGRMVGILRALLQWVLVFPMFRYYVRWKSEGVEKVRGLAEPALYVANHESFIDAVLILRALPGRLRRRIAPATGGDFFAEYPRLLLFLVRLFFNAFYLPVDPRGARQSLRHAGWLAERGYSILLFPEGERTPDGKLLPFRPGVGVMAERLRLPVVPCRLEGLFQVWPRHQRNPVRGSARLVIGEIMTLGPKETAVEFTARLEAYYRNWK